MHYSSSANEHTCAMWQQYLFSDTCQNMCAVPIVTWLIAVILYMACMYIYIFHTGLSNIWHTWHICPIWWAHLFLAHIWK